MFRLAILLFILVVILYVAADKMLSMPGKSYQGALEPLTAQEEKTAFSTRADVEMLAKTIGQRNVLNPDSLSKAADYIQTQFENAGYKVDRIVYTVDDVNCSNLETQITGASKPDEIVVVGAHYDSIAHSPGANDNASGIAALLALARTFAEKKPERTLRLVAFANEEPPYFQTPLMGSLAYADYCRKRGDNIVAAIAFDCLGCYFDGTNTQNYPFPFSFFYPSTGNFIGFVGNYSSRDLVRQVIGSFRRGVRFPSEGAALPETIKPVGWSDQWSFWQYGYKAIMVTDTGPFRYPYYHTAEDTPGKIDYERLARVVTGIECVITDLTDTNYQP
jgi:Zn-dependent M28 family amino/carboxypeptidase